MDHRIFLAVNIPISVKKVIEDGIGKIKDKLPSGTRIIPIENWHITVLFLGNQDDNNVSQISEIAKKTAAEFAPIEASFDKLTYGPSNANARMVWLTTDYETSSRLETIKQMINNRLAERGINFKREGRKFNGHLTLARLDRKIGAGDLPELDQELNITFLARSLDLMESNLKPGGAEYSLLGKFEFFY